MNERERLIEKIETETHDLLAALDALSFAFEDSSRAAFMSAATLFLAKAIFTKCKPEERDRAIEIAVEEIRYCVTEYVAELETTIQ